MSFLNKYKTDKTAEENGTWVDLDDEISVKVARLNNKDAQALRRKLEKPYRNMSTIPENIQEDILIKVVSQAVVKDWKGITDNAGKELKFSPASAETLFKEYSDFLTDVVSAAATRETFQTEALEVSKNA